MSLNIRKIMKFMVIALILCPFLYIVFIYWETYDILKQEMLFKPSLSSRLYDVNGDLFAELYDEKRLYIPIDKISPSLKTAIMAAEDSDFYMHKGFNVTSMIRALIVDIFSGEIKQGGSTITQQLAKQLYTGSEKTIRRKIAELFIARELEQRYNKDRIFEMYCNQIYFGHGVYGVQSAARFFFDTDAALVGPIESAILASLPSAPSRYSPRREPREAMRRSRNVLSAMISNGTINGDIAMKAYETFWKNYIDELYLHFPTASVRDVGIDKAPYFTEYVRQNLIKQYGEDVVYKGGLIVHTTLDMRQQTIAQNLITESVQKQNKIAVWRNQRAMQNLMLLGKERYKSFDLASYKEFQENVVDESLLMSYLFGADYEAGLFEEMNRHQRNLLHASLVEGALVAIDVDSGGITAMVGGSSFSSENQLNRTYQSFRQPASAFKPFVYGAAIEAKRITPATEFFDLPPTLQKTRPGWQPANYGNSFQGRILARRALAQSVNTVSVMIYDKVGGGQIASFASRMTGAPRQRFIQDPSLAIGTSEVSPLEMATGFAVFASGGYEVSPFAIIAVYDSDKKLVYKNPEIEKKKILSNETTYIMHSMLKDVVDSGTATYAIRGNSRLYYAAAGKTGTNSQFRDSWFVGYTPDLSVAVWFGCNSQYFTLGWGQSGSVVAAPVWGNFMNKVYEFRKRKAFSAIVPGNIVRADVCSRTGFLPANGCPAIREVFISGTIPTEVCNGDHTVMPDLIIKNENLVDDND